MEAPQSNETGDEWARNACGAIKSGGQDAVEKEADYSRKIVCDERVEKMWQERDDG